MAKIIALCGKVASGKTTYAQSIPNAIILSPDALMLGLFDGCLGDKHDETLARISRYFFELSLDIIATGSDAVLDFGFWTEETRRAFYSFCMHHKAPHELLLMKIPDNIRRERLALRNAELAVASGRQFIIDEDLLEFLDSKFCEPDMADTIICR